MQSDKFHQASMLAEEAASPNVTDISAILNSKISSPLSMKPKDSQMYWKEKASNWKEKCFSLQTMITDLHEKSINLNETLGLLTIQKIKSTQSNGMHKATTRITLVHGSMEGQDVLKLVESINNSKEKKVQEKEDREQKKNEETELFYRCKERCISDNSICKAAKLKQCPMNHQTVLKIRNPIDFIIENLFYYSL